MAITRHSVCIAWFGLLLCVSASSLPAQVSPDAGPQTQDPKPIPSASAPSLPDAPSATPSTPDPQPQLAAAPDFAATYDPLANRPLTPDEKYVFALHQAFDPGAHLVNTVRAAFQQAANGQPHYGEGWIAFEKRFFSGEVDQFTGATLTDGLLPSILREDPRYFRRGSGSKASRVWYAFNRIFVTRRDDGTSGFNNSRIFGQAISCAISTGYYPARDRTLGYWSENWGVNLGGTSAFNAFAEFYPDLKHFLFHRHEPPTAPAGN